MTRFALRSAPELAQLPVLLTAISALEALLIVEHETLDDPGPLNPTTLHRARLLREQLRSLRREINRYRRSVLAVVDPPPRRGSSR